MHSHTRPHLFGTNHTLRGSYSATIIYHKNMHLYIGPTHIQD